MNFKLPRALGYFSYLDWSCQRISLPGASWLCF